MLKWKGCSYSSEDDGVYSKSLQPCSLIPRQESGKGWGGRCGTHLKYTHFPCKAAYPWKICLQGIHRVSVGCRQYLWRRAAAKARF